MQIKFAIIAYVIFRRLYSCSESFCTGVTVCSIKNDINRQLIMDTSFFLSADI